MLSKGGDIESRIEMRIIIENKDKNIHVSVEYKSHKCGRVGIQEVCKCL